MKEIRNKKIINGIIGIVLFFVILFSGFWLIDNIFTKELKAQEVDNINLASPDLMGKEYLGNGVYNIYGMNNNVSTYNVYNGLYNFTLLNTSELSSSINITNTSIYLTAGTYTISFGNDIPNGLAHNVRDTNGRLYSFSDKKVVTFTVSNNGIYFISFYKNANTSITYTTTIQLEQGTTETNYTEPLKPIEQHEQSIYDNGYNDGYDSGFNSGGRQVHNNIIQWETFLTVSDGVGNPFELQVAKIEMQGVGNGFTELSYNNLSNYNVGMPSEVFQMYLLDNAYNHYTINSLDYRSWYDELFLPLNNYQMFSLTGAPNVEISLFGYRGFDMLDTSIDVFLGGYPNDSGNWFLIRNTKTIDEYSYDYGYEKGVNDGYDDGYGIGRQDGYNLGYDNGLIENPNNNFGSLITTILLGVGTVLGIELLPNITIGAIIAVPIVFGVIAFVLGRRKD